MRQPTIPETGQEILDESNRVLRFVRQLRKQFQSGGCLVDHVEREIGREFRQLDDSYRQMLCRFVIADEEPDPVAVKSIWSLLKQPQRSNLKQELETVGSLQDDIDRMRQEIALKLQRVVTGFAGMDFQSLEERRKLANAVQAILNQIGWAVECEVCQRPARIRAARAIKAPEGIFQFVHSKGKKTTHQGPERFPQLTLIPDTES